MATQEGSMEIEAVKVEGATRLQLKRPQMARKTAAEVEAEAEAEAEAEEEEEEILVLQGVAVPANAKVKVDVFISHKDHISCQACHTCSACEFAGSFLILPPRPLSSPSAERPPLLKSNHRLGITEILRDLNIHHEDSFSLVLVPSSQPPETPISIQSITLEHE